MAETPHEKKWKFLYFELMIKIAKNKFGFSNVLENVKENAMERRISWMRGGRERNE